MRSILLLTMLMASQLWANLEVALTTSEESTSNKLMATLTAKNSFSQRVDAARVMLFAMDESGVVVGHESAWIFSRDQSAGSGGSQLTGLDAGETAEIKFSIATERRAATTKVTFTKIVLADGSRVNPHKQVVPYEK